MTAAAFLVLMAIPVAWWSTAETDRSNIQRDMADSLTVSASSLIERSIEVQTAASVTFSDALSLQEDVPVQRDMADSLSAAASSLIERQVEIQRTASAAFSDDFNTVVEVGPTAHDMADSLSVTAATLIERTVEIQRSASASFSDALSLQEDTPVQRGMADSLTVSASSMIERILEIQRGASAAFSDALSLQEDVPVQRDMADSLTVSASSLVEATRVIAKDASASFSDSLTHVEDLATPDPPSSLNAVESVGGGTVDLTWNDNSNNETSFKVERRRTLPSTTPWNQIQSLAANTTAWEDDTGGLNPGDTYEWRVRAANARGNSAYSSTDAVTMGDLN